ncbi:hypothetical protein [Nitrosomonas ureae]|uniref:Uncharacterized protein n=1 Tax=Nitrosomonas ureae TaxID=44577 RepID=A0A1H2EQN3_9PROT|nr:hypothetical protein [Nitrosomonas ureae]ALQ51866.1 hypothetical protein ATY38_11955 [Nitrosomonas ureae]SDT97401.1 hypothetical protein SAMN05216406_11482 [Nitrosomonas ureae]
MTIGISKKVLLEYRRLRLDSEELLDRLINECVELNNWIPINENTPIDKELILYYPAGIVNHVFLPKIKLIGYHRPQLSSICRQPSHYQELSKDPE